MKSTVTSSRSCDVAELFAPRNSPACRLVAEFYFAKPWLGARWVPWLQGFTQVWTNSQAGFCTAHFIFSFVKLQKSSVAIIVILCVVLKFIDATLLFLQKAGMFFRFSLLFDCIRGETNFDVSEQEMSHLILVISRRDGFKHRSVMITSVHKLLDPKRWCRTLICGAQE